MLFVGKDKNPEITANLKRLYEDFKLYDKIETKKRRVNLMMKRNSMRGEDTGLAQLEPSLLERIHHNEEDEKVVFDNNQKLLDKLAKLERSLLKFEKQKTMIHEQEISDAIAEKK